MSSISLENKRQAVGIPESTHTHTPKEEEHSLACWDQSRHLVGFGMMSAFLKLFQNTKTLDVKKYAVAYGLRNSGILWSLLDVKNPSVCSVLIRSLSLPSSVMLVSLSRTDRSKFGEMGGEITVFHCFLVHAARQLHARKTRLTSFHKPPFLPEVRRGGSHLIAKIATPGGSVQPRVDRRPLRISSLYRRRRRRICWRM